MLKKFILLFLCLSVLIPVMFSCGKGQQENEPATSVKRVKDSAGNVYSSIVGEDGFLLLGERNELAVTVDDGKGNPGKNAKGEYVTQVEPFSGVLTVGKEAQTKFLRMPVPEKWKNESSELIRFSYEKDGKSVDLIVNERFSLSVTECQYEIDNLWANMLERKKEKTELVFGEAIKLDYEGKIIFYVFSAEERTYFVKISGDESLLKEINFEEIINTMKFRKGE